MKKILITNKLFPVECGGSEKFIWDIAKILAEEGYKVHLLTPATDKKLPEIPNINYHFIPSSTSYWGKRIAYLSKGFLYTKNVVKKVEPDLIIDNASPIPFYPIYLFTKNIKKTMVLHAIFKKNVFKFKDNLFTKFLTYFSEQSLRLFKNIDYIAVSKSTKAELQSIIGNREVSIIENSFDPYKFEYNFYDEDTFLLTLTRLSNRKGLKYLLYAWKKLNLNIPLKIAGSGPQKERLVKLKNKLNLKNVEFLGYVSEEKKVDLLKKAKLYILPTLGEGFGISNLEAMASGTPVISSDTWGVKDYIVDGENGLLAQPGNSDELAEKIELAMSDPKLRKKISQNARQTAEKYTIDNTKNQVINYINDVFNN